MPGLSCLSSTVFCLGWFGLLERNKGLLKIDRQLLHVSQVSIEEAIEANLFEYSFYLGEGNRGQAFSSPQIKWIMSGGEVFNRIFSTHFPAEHSANYVQATLGHFKAAKVPVSWLTGPTSQPADLGQTLQKVGFIYRGTWSGMALNLDDLPKQPSYPANLHIQEVTNPQTLKQWIETACLGFQFPKPMTQAYHKLFENLKVGEEYPWHLYLAFINGQPVATCSLFCGGGVAGIYWTATLPAARRRGIGTILTRKLLEEAREAGHQYVVLHSTQMGEPVYKYLNFREYCKIGIYTWSPDSKITQLAAKIKNRLLQN